MEPVRGGSPYIAFSLSSDRRSLDKKEENTLPHDRRGRLVLGRPIREVTLMAYLAMSE